MYRAAQVEDTSSCQVAEKVARLEYENKHLRELLHFSTPRDKLVIGEMLSSSENDPGAPSSPASNRGTRSNNSVKESDIIR